MQLKNEKQLRSLVDFNTGVALGMLFPATPLTSMYRGEDTQKIVAQTAASSITTWLFLQYLGVSVPIGGITAVRPAVFGSVTTAVAPALAAGAGVVMASELQTTLHSNLGMEEIPGSRGGYSNPMGGSSETYYPFKGLVDYFKG